MNFYPLNVVDLNADLPQVTSGWMAQIIQPSLAVSRPRGTDYVGPLVPQVKTFSTKTAPDPWRGTSARTGPDPARGTAIRDPPNAVSSPFVFAYQAPPAQPSNAGFSLRSVPDSRRGTSTPFYGTVKPYFAPAAMSWKATAVEPSRPVLRASGTDLVRPFGELVFADKWTPTIVQPNRLIVRARGTDSVFIREITSADKWQPTWIQPDRPVSRTKGTEFVYPIIWTPFVGYGESILGSNVQIDNAGNGVWKSTGLTITLPNPGTYLVNANARAQVAINTVNDNIQLIIGLWRSDTSAQLTNSSRLLMIDYDETGFPQLESAYNFIVTITSSITLTLYAMASWTIGAAGVSAYIISDANGWTTLNYVQLA